MAKLGRYSADRKKIEAVGAGSKALTVADCGTIFTLGSETAGAIAITLPQASKAGKGWWAKFIIVADPHDHSHTITKNANDSNNIRVTSHFVSGAMNLAKPSDGTVSAHSSGSADDVITFVTDKATIGDQVEIVCDGSDYYATAFIYQFDGLTSA